MKDLYDRWITEDHEYIINNLLKEPSTVSTLEILDNQLTNDESDGTLIKKKNNIKENKTMDFGFNDMFGKMFRPCPAGNCKLAMNGQIAVKTRSGYKTFDLKKMKLVNCTNFAFDMDNMFWIVPTFKVEKGDIIFVNDRPNCVIDVFENSIKVFSYDNSTIDEIVPENHVFMGKTYCYGKIFSPFMNMDKSENGLSTMMNMMMMNQMFGGNNNGNMGFNPMVFAFMNKDNPFMNMFEGAFNFGEDKIIDKEET